MIIAHFLSALSDYLLNISLVTLDLRQSRPFRNTILATMIDTANT